MRIPHFMIKFHQRVKGTRVWRHRWKIVAIAPFVLALGIFLFYTGYRILAEKRHEEFVTQWKAKGESLDPDQLYPDQPDESQDFFKHPSVIKEINGHYGKKLERIYSLGIKGITDDSNNYSTSGGKGTYAMGIPADVHLWLDPPEPSLSEQEVARKCLRLISPFDKRLDALVEASKRPEAFQSKGFDASGNILSDGTNMAALNMRGTTMLLSDRIILKLIAGDEPSAAVDMAAHIRIAELLCKGHNLFGYLVGAAMLKAVERPLWEGLRRHRWSDESLALFDGHLAHFDEHRRFLRCMRQEMAYTHFILLKLHENPDYMEKQYRAVGLGAGSSTKKTWKERGQEAWEALKPRGWYLSKGTRQMSILDQELFYPGGKKCAQLTIGQARRLEVTPNPMHDPFFDELMTGEETMNLYARQIGRVLHAQAYVNIMRTAIALERYHLKNGAYPDKLASLVPDFLTKVFPDSITGKPLNYRIKPDGTPLIYSVGYDEKDHGGRPNRNIETSDWAWMYSPPASFTFDDYRRR